MLDCCVWLTLLLQVLSSACLCLYTPGPPVPSQISLPSGPAPEQPIPFRSPSESNCNLRVEPPELVVRFGDPVSVNCFYSHETVLGWEGLPVEIDAVFGTFLPWTEESVSSWSIQPTCYTPKEVGHCVVALALTVYQPPDRVSLSFRNHTGPLPEDSAAPLVEGRLYSLQCEVEAVAPAQNMTVAFYRGHRELGLRSSRTQQKSPVNETLSLDYRVSRQDHGAHFWCEVRLELGPGGPQPPPVVRSQNVTANVQFREEQVEAPPTRSSREHAGRATISAQSQRGQRQHPKVTEAKGAGLAPGSSAFVVLALLLIHTKHWL